MSDSVNSTKDLPETGITPGGTTGACRDVLSKDHARRGKPPLHFADMTEDERIAKAKDLGLPKFRVKQLANHYYGHFDVAAEEFSDFPAAKRAEAAEAFFPTLITEVTRQVADEGTTIKTLWRLFDGSLIESVLMRYPTRTTLCISSQVGCGMGCPFCATGQLGLTRNMSAGEILEQVRVAAKAMHDGEVAGGLGRLSNIVFMGMGEPLDNTDEVLRALEIITAEWGFGWSPTRITLSTAGVVPELRRFLDATKVHLAVSLHNPFHEERMEIMPVERAWPIAEVAAILREYDFTHQRRVSFEYIVMSGLNDSPRHIRELTRLLNGIKCRINLIRFHRIPDSPYFSPGDEAMVRFRDALTARGIQTTIRASRGEDIQAACGLLSTRLKGGI